MKPKYTYNWKTGLWERIIGYNKETWLINGTYLQPRLLKMKLRTELMETVKK